MNRFPDAHLATDRLANVRYFASDMEILTPGSHVICAVTGERIPIANLRYWDHVSQEAYKDAAAAGKRYEERQAKASRG